MIRHLENNKVWGREKIIKELGFDYGLVLDSAIKRVYRLKKKINITIHKENNKYFITKDEICTFRSTFLFDRKDITNCLFISKSALSKMIKETDVPIYKLNSKKGHKLYTFKNTIAHWYFDYLLKNEKVTARESLFNFVSKVKCAICGKNLFLIPGISCGVKGFDGLKELIDKKYLKRFLTDDPTCPTCHKPIYSCKEFHRIENWLELFPVS